MNLGAQLGPMSITKLSPNWACQMGPIHCPKFLLSGESPLGVCPIRLFCIFLIVCIRDLSSPIIASTSSFVVCSVDFLYYSIYTIALQKPPFILYPLIHGP